MIGDGPGDFALNRENICKIAMVSLCPKRCRIGARVDQLRIDPDAIRRALDAAFQKMCHTECLTDLTQVCAALPFCMTEVRLITFKSAIFARAVRISSCTPSAKKGWLFLRSGFRRVGPRCSFLE